MDNGTEKGQESRMDNRKRLEELYDHIFAEGKKALARGGVVDSFLANPRRIPEWACLWLSGCRMSCRILSVRSWGNFGKWSRDCTITRS